MFSASYSDRFDAEQRQRAAQKRPRATWKRGLRPDSETLRFGYYLEERTPSPAPEAYAHLESESEAGPSTAPSRPRTPPPRADRSDPNRATGREGTAPSKDGSHGGLRVYISNLQIILPGLSLFSRRPPKSRKSSGMARTHLLVSLWCVACRRCTNAAHTGRSRFAITIPIIFWDAFYCFLR